MRQLQPSLDRTTQLQMTQLRHLRRLHNVNLQLRLSARWPVGSCLSLTTGGQQRHSNVSCFSMPPPPPEVVLASFSAAMERLLNDTTPATAPLLTLDPNNCSTWDQRWGAPYLHRLAHLDAELYHDFHAVWVSLMVEIHSICSRIETSCVELPVQIYLYTSWQWTTRLSC